MYCTWRNKYLDQQNYVYVAQLNVIWVIENLITVTGDLFYGFRPLVNWRITAYLEISSVIHRYNRLNCILYDCVTDNYRYIILAIFEYRYIALVHGKN